jgi:hypothetical protein
VHGLDALTYTLFPLDDFEDVAVRYHEAAQLACSVPVSAPANGVVLDLPTATLVVTMRSFTNADSKGPQDFFEWLSWSTVSLSNEARQTTEFFSQVGDDMRPRGEGSNTREFIVLPEARYILNVRAEGHKTVRQEVIAPRVGERKQCDVTLIQNPEYLVRLRLANIDPGTVSHLRVLVQAEGAALAGGNSIIESSFGPSTDQTRSYGKLSDDGVSFILKLRVSPGFHPALVTVVTHDGAQYTTRLEFDFRTNAHLERYHSLTMTPRAEPK